MRPDTALHSTPTVSPCLGHLQRGRQHTSHGVLFQGARVRHADHSTHSDRPDGAPQLTAEASR